jgi:hypothetical protein
MFGGWKHARRPRTAYRSNCPALADLRSPWTPDANAMNFGTSANEPVPLVPNKQPLIGRQTTVQHVLRQSNDLLPMQVSSVGQQLQYETSAARLATRVFDQVQLPLVRIPIDPADMQVDVQRCRHRQERTEFVDLIRSRSKVSRMLVQVLTCGVDDAHAAGQFNAARDRWTPIIQDGVCASDRGREDDDAEPNAKGCSESGAEGDRGHVGDDDFKNVHLDDAPCHSA